jgi:hypothetical protein
MTDTIQERIKMDFIFWIPWAVGVVVFIVWIRQPISEFKKLWQAQKERMENTKIGE